MRVTKKISIEKKRLRIIVEKSSGLDMFLFLYQGFQFVYRDTGALKTGAMHTLDVTKAECATISSPSGSLRCLRPW
jgi:hypothetical protein